jgi:hypothetical protein
VIFDREALIEADSQSRANALAVGRQNGWWSANDVRRKLNENPIPPAEGGDDYHMNGNFIPLTGAPEVDAQPTNGPSNDEDQPSQVM